MLHDDLGPTVIHTSLAASGAPYNRCCFMFGKSLAAGSGMIAGPLAVMMCSTPRLGKPESNAFGDKGFLPLFIASSTSKEGQYGPLVVKWC